MKPGRELDKKIAVKVMGLIFNPDGTVSRPGDDRSCGILKPYSTKNSCVSLIEKKLETEGKLLIIQSQNRLNDPNPESYTCKVVSSEDSMVIYSMASSTYSRAHAVCLAVLKDSKENNLD